MRRKRLLALATGVSALVAGPLGAAPAQAQCEKMTGDPQYVCDTIMDTVVFADQEAREAYARVVVIYNDLGQLVVDTVCTVFPGAEQCQP